MGERLGLGELKELIELCKTERISKISFHEVSFEIELPESDDMKARTAELDDMLKKAQAVSDDEILFNPYAGIEDLRNADN